MWQSIRDRGEGLFPGDRADPALRDDASTRLPAFPDVPVTDHRGFFARRAPTAIAATTVRSFDALARPGGPCMPRWSGRG